MINKIRRLNESLPGMLLVIISSGTLFGLVFVWFVEQKYPFVIGLFIGCIMSMVMAWHMAYCINIAVDYDEGTATKYIQKHNVIRYTVVAVICIITIYAPFVNPLAVFLGLMTLKVSAYLQPFTHKLFRR